MKSNNTFYILRGITFLTLIFLSQIAFGQACTEGAGLGNNQNITSGHTAVGQSFTANCGGGPITSITLAWNTNDLGPTDDRQLNIYDGPDFNSAVLYTQVIPFGSIVDGPNTFAITPPVPINQGETNSFEITAVGGGTQGSIANGVLNGNNVYPGGQAPRPSAT